MGALLDRVQVSAVPEPGTLALVLGALGLMAHRARRSAR
ncbi:MAG TPA: PEP-CTERM sorting domain-containing protein [Rubrivivax sp.]|nr:PEP-CTERM sorting domain-containing protein [Rubrivivax sp.]